jgi:hypothetical protein
VNTVENGPITRHRLFQERADASNSWGGGSRGRTPALSRDASIAAGVQKAPVGVTHSGDAMY